MDKIKVGQIGICHEHAAVKMKSLLLHPEVFEVVGVVDDTASTAPRRAGHSRTQYPGLPFMSEEQLFQVPGLQAVMIETANHDLVAAAQRCLEKGLAVHMDKPGGVDMDAFVKMRLGFAEQALPFQMGYMFRDNPAMQWLRQAISNGWLGEVFSVQASMSHNYGDDAYQDYISNFPGGIMFNLGCHLLDLVVKMLGVPERATPFLQTVAGDQDGVNNHALAVLEYPHALACLWACSREVQGLPRRSLKVCGTNGTAVLCPLERFDGQPLLMELTLNTANEKYDAGQQTLNFGVIKDRYDAQLLQWAEMIRGKQPADQECKHDLLVQEILLDICNQKKWRKV